MLDRYSEIRIDKSRKNQSLLLGNGFSISINHSFRYRSLFDDYRRLVEDPFTNTEGAKGGEVYRSEDLLLFDEYGTDNFETVLEHLRGSDAQVQYKRVQNALVKTIQRVHPDFKREIEGHLWRKAAELFRLHENVFTTNYDLLTYWVMAEDFDLFGDLFKGSSTPYLLQRAEERTLVFYLHGAQHLYQDEDGKVKKVQRNERSSLSEILMNLTDQGSYPLFVAEGASEQKLQTISTNRYLRFCLKRLSELTGDLTVIGHSLSEFDQHIVDAINESSVGTIFVGMHGDPEEKELDQKRRKFPRKEVMFFSTKDFRNEEPIINPFVEGRFWYPPLK